jgi:hypothetical protein
MLYLVLDVLVEIGIGEDIGDSSSGAGDFRLFYLYLVTVCGLFFSWFNTQR